MDFGNGIVLNEEVMKEWIFDVSKKIAFLTKKVFRLHSEALDRKDEIKRLKEAMEDEYASSSAQTRKEMEGIKKYKQTFAQTADNLIRNEFQKEFNKISSKYDDERQRVEDRVTNITQMFVNQMKIYEKQYNSLQEKINQQKENKQKTQEMLNKIKNHSLEKLQEKHKNELEYIVNQENGKYNAYYKEMAQKEEKMKQQYEDELEKLRSDKAEEQKKSTHELVQKVKDRMKEYKKLEGERDEIVVLVDELKLHLIQMQQEADSWIKKITKSNEDKLGKYTEEANRIQKETDEMKENYEKQIADLENRIKEEENEYERAMKAIQDQIQQERDEHDKQMKILLESSQTNSAESDTRKQQIENEHKQMIDELNQRHMEFVAEAQRKEKELKEEMEENQKKHELEVQSLKSAIFAAKTKMDQELDE